MSEIAVTYNDKHDIAISYEEFLKLREKNQGDGNTYEYIDGYMYMFGAPSDYHAKLLSTIGAMLENYINKNNLNCAVFSGAAIQSKINNKIKDVIPDLMIKCKDEKGTMQTFLVIEIVSPSNADKDFSRNLALYRKMGIKEYWTIDSRVAEWDFEELVQRYFYPSYFTTNIDVFGVDSLFTSNIFEGLEFQVRDLYKSLNFLLGNIF